MNSTRVATDYSPPSTATDRCICYVYFAHDIGLAIDLDHAERHIRFAKQREFIRRTRKAPRYFQYHPPPLRVTISVDPIAIGPFATENTLDVVIYDFGAVTVIYRVVVSGVPQVLDQLSRQLYDNDALLVDSRLQAVRLIEGIRPAITKPCLADLVEDYIVFQVESDLSGKPPQEVLCDRGGVLAQLLRAETEPLSPQETDDALSCRISFGPQDLAIIDWNAAFLIGGDMDDVLAVLEFANIELLEMRFLDDQLDRALEDAYTGFAKHALAGAWRPKSRARVLKELARLQIDSAYLFESVNNTLKLLGDPYLARVYRLASQRFHLVEWDATILRKLGTIESIYSKISDQQSAWRMEVLEWIIILLIAISIVISFK